ncbi:transposase [Lactococcus chungangensis]|uniref:transposase n=1 Tax=Pseudolactococcus chungangensis TaxID=451457 RepID=UPI00373588E1
MTYFFKFPRTERLKVKEIVMDMNTNYLALLPILFPNAIPIIDGFYVVQQLSRAFNQLQIKELNRLKKCLETTGKSIESQKNTGEIYSSMTVKK